MNAVLLVVGLLMGASSFAETSTIIGAWKFSEIIYRGQTLPLPNPDLNLSWVFFKNGTARLYWDRGTSDFCERFSTYQWKNDFLDEEVFAVNPGNALECQQDLDMQVGRKTHTPLDFRDHQLRMHFQLGDDELIYILKALRIEEIDFK